MNYIDHIENSFSKAKNEQSKINKEILDIEGMSGKLTRHFYNNLLNFNDARLLEIGVWKGSSTCSLMFKNKAFITCIDNWSQFGGPKNEFISNIEKYKGNNIVEYFDTDCFEFNINKLTSKYNIYLYDGDHSYDSHFKALKEYLPVLDKTFIYIVDDWNWEEPRKATENAIKELQLKILYKFEIKLNENNMHTHHMPDGLNLASETWWNGIGVYILEK